MSEASRASYVESGRLEKGLSRKLVRPGLEVAIPGTTKRADGLAFLLLPAKDLPNGLANEVGC